MIRRKLRIIPIIALLLASFWLLPGCFDYGVTLTLFEDGRGNVMITLDMPQSHARGQKGRKLETVLYPRPVTEVREENGRLIIEEISRFDYMDVVLAKRVQFSIETIGTGVLGLSDYTYRLTAQVQSAEGDLPDREILPGTERELKAQDPASQDKARKRAQRLLATSLAGHYVFMTFEVPGTVEEAQPLILGGSRVDPEISQDGSRVSWKVPLSVLVGENIRHNLTFQAVFKGMVAFRVDTQQEAHTRYPTAEDIEDYQQQEKEQESANQQP